MKISFITQQLAQLAISAGNLVCPLSSCVAPSLIGCGVFAGYLPRRYLDPSGTSSKLSYGDLFPLIFRFACSHETSLPTRSPITNVPMAIPATAASGTPLLWSVITGPTRVVPMVTGPVPVPVGCATVTVAAGADEEPSVAASFIAPSLPQHVVLFGPQHHVSLVAVPSHGVMR